jgi:phosphoribosyl 1,2-cyclic phosphate phosphodiesterase
VVLEILGSGGAVTTPRPGCECRVCAPARELGPPHARGGPCVFLHGPDVLFDTPEDVKELLNRARIPRVAACFYSHWHPDHVMGRRVFETMNFDFFGWPREAKRTRTTDVYLPAQVASDFRERFGGWEHLEFMAERQGSVRVVVLEDGQSVALDGVTITPFRLHEEFVYAFLLETGDRRVLLAMDELHGWQPPAFLRGVDLAVMPMGLCEVDPLTGDRRIHPEHPVLRFEATFRDTLAMVRALGAGRVVLSHIEEPNRLTLDELEELEQQLRADGLPVAFARDALRVPI